VNYHPSSTKTIIIAVAGTVAVGVLAFITGAIYQRIKRRNASKGKQQQHWYGQ
jgi:hypothetical protein